MAISWKHSLHDEILSVSYVLVDPSERREAGEDRKHKQKDFIRENKRKEMNDGRVRH